MIDLTPAQLQLIKDAQAKEDGRVNFYGIRETTKQKLMDGGLVETVMVHTPDEQAELKDEIRGLTVSLTSGLDTASSVALARISREISHRITKIFSTKDVLTDLGKTV